MLYQLSYASKFGGKTRYRANLSLRSLPDVRDNYLRYHKGKLGCNNGLGRRLYRLFFPQGHHGIHTRGPSGRNNACRQRDRGQNHGDQTEGCRIVDRHAKH
jgi:hypothetical protein